MTPEKLKDLLKDLEALEGPSREVDGMFVHVLMGVPLIKGNHPILTPKGDIDPIIPRYTASVDAAIVLCEDVLPGDTLWDVSNWGPCVAHVTPKHTDHRGKAATPALALALLCAVLKAKIALLEAEMESEHA